MLDSDLPDLGRNQMSWADVDIEVAEGLGQLWETLGIERLIQTWASWKKALPSLQHNGILQLAVTCCGTNEISSR